MSLVQFRRIDAAKNMHRFYSLMNQLDLFGGYALVRGWGRIGAYGQVRRDPFPT